MDESIEMLKLNYTYTIACNEPDKIKRRTMIGQMQLELLEIMRDELIEAGTLRWRQYQDA